MNASGGIFALLGFAVVAGVVIMSDTNKRAEVRSAVVDKAYTIAKESKTDWIDEFNLSVKKADAKSLLDVFEKAEKDRITRAFDNSEAAKDATKKFNKAEAAYKAAKKAVDEYKPSQTKVAVGTGDSAISLDMVNTDKKAELQMKLAELSAKRDSAKSVVEDIRKDITAKIRDERPIEHTEAIDKYHRAVAEYDNAVNKNQKSIDDILSDKEWYDNECRVELRKRYTKSEIIIKASLLSVIPVIALVLIWKRAINDIGFIYGGV